MRLVPLLVLLAALAPAALAQTAPEPGACTLGRAEAVLDAGDARAVVFNTGSLFYGNDTRSGDGYLVPEGSGDSPIFASSLWLGGKVDGELRVAGGNYGAPAVDFTFWPGPLGDDARPVDPTDCSAFDRIYTVSRADVAEYYRTGRATDDLRDWPWALGAPVLDGDGDPSNYDLAGGDQPAVRGDQVAWWVMNDVGNVHPAQNTPPLGVEVRVEASAVVLGPFVATTVYRYTVTNRTAAVIDSAYTSLFADPDLGDAVDDYVATDTTSGMAYTYNADNADLEYGVPPAVGFQVVSGPVGLPNGRDDDRDGATDEPGERLGLTASQHVASSIGGGSDPNTGPEMYNRMRGVWNDGSPMRAFADGYQEVQGDTTTFAFPGDPVRGLMWSEFNSGNGVNPPGDRRVIVHAGPFRLLPGQSETVVFGVPFAQGTSNLDSVVRLRQLARVLRVAHDGGYFDPVRVEGFTPPELPDVVSLGRPSPNPYTDRAVVLVRAPVGARVRAELYDVLGRRVAVLHDGP
ncbi:MAG TPA: hypothetical protein VF576_11780, partial [Rubricoccaceae bacterium]